MTARIRVARIEEIPQIQSIEHRAGRAFVPYGIDESELSVVPTDTLRSAIDRAGLWVAVDDRDAPMGFAFTEPFPNSLYLHELDVLPEHQGQGLGRALVTHVLDQARREGLARVTLTTYRDVPFNAPFYARIGFEVIDALPAWLAAIREHEASIGLDAQPRVAMAMAT